MGHDKASLPFGDETLLDRVLRLVATVADDIVLAAAPAQPVPAGVRVSRDATTGVGPLPALVAALPCRQRAANLRRGLRYSAASARTCIALLIDAREGWDGAVPLVDGRRDTDVRGIPDRRPAATPASASAIRDPAACATSSPFCGCATCLPAFSRPLTRSSRASRPAIRRRSIGERWTWPGLPVNGPPSGAV